VTAIVIDPGSFGLPLQADDLLAELSGSHIPAYRVKQGDDIARALATARGR